MTPRPLRLLFVHQNFPGQFRHLCAALAGDPAFHVLGIGEEREKPPPAPPGVQVVRYPVPGGAGPATHHYVKEFEAGVRRGQAVVRAAHALAQKGYAPDVIVAHPAWGDALFLRDVFQRAKIVQFFEFFYAAEGADTGFDPEYPASFDDRFRLRIKNTLQLHALASADVGISPTEWQRSRYPAEARAKIRLLHDGIRTDLVTPDPGARFVTPSGVTLTREAQVITYVARNLEPYRGFHVFMRALPRILRELPQARVVIVGADGVSYGRKPKPPHESYRKQLLDEVGAELDAARVHFTGQLSYADFVSLLRVSSLHVYLTYPFVLSWSMLEAMSAGCTVLASSTAPVTEVIEEGRNGFLFDFFSVEELSEKAVDLVRRRDALREIGSRARADVVSRYDFSTVALPGYRGLIGELARRRTGTGH